MKDMIKYIVGFPFLVLCFVVLLTWVPVTFTLVTLLKICNACYDFNFKINIRTTE